MSESSEEKEYNFGSKDMEEVKMDKDTRKQEKASKDLSTLK